MATSTSEATTPRAKLYLELCVLRERGLADPQDRWHQCRLLLHVASLAGRGSTDLERVKNVLEQATEQMGEVHGPSLRAMLGITAASWGRKSTERRQLAYEIFCEAERAFAASLDTGCKPIVFQTFRTHKTEEMLENLASQLLQIAQTQSNLARAVRDPNLANGTTLSDTRNSK